MNKKVILSFIGLGVFALALLFLLRQRLDLISPDETVTREDTADWLYEASYIGPEACGECHTKRFNNFRQTAHFHTAHEPDEKTIAGKFSPGKARLETRNPNLHFEMSQQEGGYYQTAVLKTRRGVSRHSARIDFVIGSGKLGQTYLYWSRNRLFQLPVSYLTASDEWVNSPGYLSGVADFKRPILPRCMECHATYFEAPSHNRNVYKKEHYILGVTCERCHGPGSMHAEYHRENPDMDEAFYIQYPEDFSRERLIDLCSQCHSGQGVVSLKTPFSFRPGEDLAKFIVLKNLDEQSQSGTHAANQVARLSRSKCFQQSNELTCISCHNPHKLERGKLALFSKRCMKCHEPEVCKMSTELGERIQKNCIDCHMPRVEDANIDIETTGGFAFPVIPDHVIGIYPEISQRILARFSNEDEE